MYLFVDKQMKWAHFRWQCCFRG